ncbi:NAD dependent epimerase/dehydratase, putative [Talaromyces stipitatus ATCC 10500]|uniref:NAD dependent epimerase/dehydratase, putative n=1 Tax=Talaromyces stipitatus (strain ATCC 10500 / CBS 375.48 / QM 6759 / NRRL 1006) TaxID=441959 RepID=B8M6U9_TALSN|nr:NAD dependent epimerase/dehydratase, putative [Talaromyces stipitatus ATCC 10500]EED20169.1 NAD dependent epimerase/dehydratase, putative [Talaromyces stipitatus ATCC 10500]
MTTTRTPKGCSNNRVNVCPIRRSYVSKNYGPSITDIMAQPTKSRIFMTGASGYLGSVITEHAIAHGYEVHGLSRIEASDEKLRSLGAVPVRGDLQALDVLRHESANAEIIIHLADVMTRNPDYHAGLRIDAAAVDAICETIQGTDKPLLVTSGSLVVEADPNGEETTETSPLQKKPVNDRFKAEDHAINWAREKGVRVIAIRLAPYVYGRGGSGIRLFMQMHARNGEVTCVEDGSTRTSTVHVDDAARMYILAAEKASAGEVYNCTSSTDVTALQLAEAMGSILALPVKFFKFDEAVAKFGPFFSKFLCAVNRASSAKAFQRLGWQPREPGIIDDIKSGSYLAVTEKLRGKQVSNT